MNNEIYIIKKDTLMNTANAIREKTGNIDLIKVEDFPSAIEAIEAGVSENLDEEIATQEEKIALQDTLIASIAAALEGKAAGGGSSSKTINLNWDDDVESTCEIVYLSNDGVKKLYRGNNITTIEAIYGVVALYDPNEMCSYNDTFMQLITSYGLVYTLIATQDNETIYLASTDQI